MKSIILIFILFTSGIIFAQKNDSLKIKELYQKIDSIEYSESDFINMQKHYLQNKELTDLISKKASNEDKNVYDFFELLTITYDKAVEKYGQKEIKVIIHSYYESVRIMKKFEKLNSDFDKKIDSLKLEKEYYQRQMKKDKRIIDSLKNN